LPESAGRLPDCDMAQAMARPDGTPRSGSNLLIKTGYLIAADGLTDPVGRADTVVS
jgi:hypothetical protein